MKRVAVLLALLMASCGGVERVDKRTYRTGNTTDWKVIDRAVVSAQITTDYSSMAAVINASTTTVVTYTVAEAKTFNLDLAALVPAEINDGDTLSFGTIEVDNLKVNKLKQCGPGDDQKCTSAIVRVYTEEVVGFPGISGMVNKDEGYSVPINAGEGSPSESVGLTDTNAAIVDSYTIPANDRKLRPNDFNGMTYVLESDFSNAGAGDYEATIVIELAVGL